MPRAVDLGERRIIELFWRSLERMPKAPIPLGDDVSAVRISRGRLAVVKCDMLVRETDIPRGMSLWQAGRKAAVMAISDLASKGVRPVGLLCSVGIPRNLREDEIRQIASGFNAGAREYGAYVIGGDTNEAPDVIIDSVALGIADERRLMRRDSARPGDVLAVTGTFGSAAAGLEMTLGRKRVPEGIGWRLAKVVYLPEARLREGLALAKTGLVTSSIDSSDGLAWSLHEVARMSGVGFNVETVPISYEARKFAELTGADPYELAMYGGEEYELVVTIRRGNFTKARRAVPKLMPIGEVTSKGGRILVRRGIGYKRVSPRGWEHFAPRRPGPD